ncbi:Chromo domain-containing protein [Entamoeba marina]
MKINLNCLTNNDRIAVSLGEKRTLRFLKNYLLENEMIRPGLGNLQWYFYQDDVVNFKLTPEFQSKKMHFVNQYTNDAAAFLDETYRSLLLASIPLQYTTTDHSIFMFGVEFFIVNENKEVISSVNGKTLQFEGNVGMFKIENGPITKNVDPYTISFLPITKPTSLVVSFQPLIQYSQGDQPNFYPLTAPPHTRNTSISITSILSHETTIQDVQQDEGIGEGEELNLFIAKTLKTLCAFVNNGVTIIEPISIPIQPTTSLQDIKDYLSQNGIPSSTIFFHTVGMSKNEKFTEENNLFEMVLLGKVNSLTLFVCCEESDLSSFSVVDTLILSQKNIPFDCDSFITTRIPIGCEDDEVHSNKTTYLPFVKQNPIEQPNNDLTKSTDIKLSTFSLEDTEQKKQLRMEIDSISSSNPSVVNEKGVKKPNTEETNKSNLKKTVVDEIKLKKKTNRKQKQEQINDFTNLTDIKPVFEVEKIIDRRRRGRKIEYLVKWKNFRNSENTWEDREDLKQQYSTILDEYDSNTIKKPRKTKEQNKEIGKIFDAWKSNEEIMVLYEPKGKQRNIYPSALLKTRNPTALLEYYEERLFSTTKEKEE